MQRSIIKYEPYLLMLSLSFLNYLAYIINNQKPLKYRSWGCHETLEFLTWNCDYERLKSLLDIVDVHILWCTWWCSSWMWTGIRGDVTQGISDVTPNSGSHPTTAPPSASQDVNVDYIYSSNCNMINFKLIWNSPEKLVLFPIHFNWCWK